MLYTDIDLLKQTYMIASKKLSMLFVLDIMALLLHMDRRVVVKHILFLDKMMGKLISKH